MCAPKFTQGFLWWLLASRGPWRKGKERILTFSYVNHFAIMKNYRNHLVEKLKQVMSVFDKKLDSSTMVWLGVIPWDFSLLPSPNKHRLILHLPNSHKELLNPLLCRDGFAFLLLPVSLSIFALRIKSLDWSAELLQEVQKAHSHCLGNFFLPAVIWILKKSTLYSFSSCTSAYERRKIPLAEKTANLKDKS